MKASKQAKSTKAPAKPQRGHIHEHVLQYMCRGLMIGAFLPGQVLSLRKLAAGLGTSPMPVREVLSRLVAAKALEETSSGSVRVPRLSPEKLSDLFSVREMLEGEAAERAATRATPALVSQLTSINKSLLQAIAKREILNCLSYNQSFHLTLYRSCESDILLPLIEALWLQFGPTMYMSLLIPSMPWSASAHESILECLRTKDGSAVRQGIIEDIRGTCSALLSINSAQIIDLPFAQFPELHFNN
jgi:DNA-binding GntR family transcriptional regulator